MESVLSMAESAGKLRPLPRDSRVRQCKPSLAPSKFPSSQFWYLCSECHLLEPFQERHSSNFMHSLIHHQVMSSLSIWSFPSNHIYNFFFPSYKPKQQQQNNFILLSYLATSPLFCFSSQHNSWKDFYNTYSFQSLASYFLLDPFLFWLSSTLY